MRNLNLENLRQILAQAQEGKKTGAMLSRVATNQQRVVTNDGTVRVTVTRSKE